MERPPEEPGAALMKQRFIARWFDGAAIAVALVAALALTMTVLVARRELESASLAMVRGEGEALATRLHERGLSEEGPPTQAQLEGQLAELEPSGLRFVELSSLELSAGQSQIEHAGLTPGTVVVRGRRALLVSPVPDRAGGPPPPFPPDEDLRGPPGTRPPPFGPALVLEFEPTVLVRVSTGMDHTLVVAAGAVVVLLAFAGVLTARVVRRGRDERRAEQERRLAALGQMAGVMAHELRNPLTSLKGHAQLLVEMLAGGTREHAKAELVVSEAVRLERLTQDLLAFVRDARVVVREVSPSTLVDRALRDLPRDRIEVDLDRAPSAIWVDEARLSAAIGNLVQNALQATPGELPVRVRVAGDAGDVVVDVRDEGPGISAGDEERVFEPFFTTRIHGTGLGLAVARRAVEEHGGTLRLEPSPAGGAVFRIRLPDAATGPKTDTR